MKHEIHDGIFVGLWLVYQFPTAWLAVNGPIAAEPAVAFAATRYSVTSDQHVVLNTLPTPTPQPLAWQRLEDFPISAYQYDPVEYNGYLYVVGGYNGTVFSTTYFSRINADGSLATWRTTTPLPEPDQGPSVAVDAGFIYVATGTHHIYRAHMNSDGTLGSWASESTPNAFHGGTRMAMKAYRSHLYALGGYEPVANFYTDAFVAATMEDGSLGDWIRTTPLPQPVQHQSVHFIDDRVYTVGGITSGLNIVATVVSAPINPDGTLGAWRMETPLPYPLWYNAAATIGDELWILGGRSDYGAGRYRYAVLRGTVNPEDGSIGQWITAGQMPSDSVDGPAAVYVAAAHSAYVVGGFDFVQGHNTAEVWRLPLGDIPPTPAPSKPAGYLTLSFYIDQPSTATHGQIWYKFTWTSDGGDFVSHGPKPETYDLLTEMNLVQPGETWTATVTPLIGEVEGESIQARAKVYNPESGIWVWSVYP